MKGGGKRSPTTGSWGIALGMAGCKSSQRVLHIDIRMRRATFRDRNATVMAAQD